MSVLPAFSLAEPSTVEEAVALKSAHPGSRYLGGGTDLIPNLRRGIGRPDLLISLAGIPALQGVSLDEEMTNMIKSQHAYDAAAESTEVL